MIIVIFAIVIAIATGLGYTGRAAHSNYLNRVARAEIRRGLTAHALDSGMASRTQAAGIKAGALIGTSVGGWSVMWAAFLRGLKVGYPRGVERGRNAKAWVRDRVRGTAELSLPGAGLPVSPDVDRVESLGRCAKTIVEGRFCGRRQVPGSQFCEMHVKQTSVPVVVPVPTKTGESVSKPTGEVQTAEQLRVLLQRMIRDAQAELEDALADLARAQQMVGSVDQMISNMIASKIDHVAVAAAQDLLDVCAADVTAASSVVAKKEAVAAAAQRALDVFNGSAQTQFHSN